MKQIYSFEAAVPPVLTERMLEAELERRKLRRQTGLVALGGILLQIAVMVLAMICSREYPILIWIALGSLIVSTVGGGVVALVFAQKRRVFLYE